jgi:DNA-binding Lrp family transcriptional regulator
VVFVGLSRIDLKVLRFAATRGLHFPEAEIAKRLRLSEATVNYSLNKLRKSNAIMGFRYKLDYRKMGLNGLAWVLFSRKHGVGQQWQILRKLLSYPQVHVASFVTGRKDIALKVIDKDVLAINNFLLDVSAAFSAEIQDPLVLFSTRQFKSHNICIEPRAEAVKLDSLDLGLLDKKMRNPDTALKDAARELGVHHNTVSRRWRRLCSKGIIIKKSPRLNPEYYLEVGAALKTLVLFDVSPTFREKFVSMMTRLPQVHELHSLLSGHDFLSVIRTRDIAEFYSLLESVSSAGHGSVRGTVSRVFLKTELHPPNYLSELKERGAISF